MSMEMVTEQEAEDFRKVIFYYIVHLKEGEERPFWADAVLDYWHVDGLKQRQLLMYGHNARYLEDCGNLHSILLRRRQSGSSRHTKLRHPLPLYGKLVADIRDGGAICQTVLHYLFVGNLWVPALQAAANSGILGNVLPFLKWAGAVEKGSPGFSGSFLVSFWSAARVAAEQCLPNLLQDLLHFRLTIVPDGYSIVPQDEVYAFVCPWMYIVWRSMVDTCNMEILPSTFLHDYGGLEPQVISKGWSFLHFAAVWGDTDCMGRLLDDANFEVDAVSELDGLTPLHLAAFYGRLEVVKLLLQCNANVNLQAQEAKHTPLYYACMRNHTSVVKEILHVRKEAAHVDAVNVYGMTALHMAAARGNMEFMRELLRHTQDPNLRTTEDCLHQRIRAGDYLRGSSKGSMKILERVKWSGFAGMWDKLQPRLDLDPMFLKPNDLESTIWSPAGFTMLHFAIVYGDLSPTTILDLCEQDKRVDLKTKDYKGLTCLDWAITDRAHEGAISDRSHDFNTRMVCMYCEEIKEANREKERLQWAVELGAALLSNNWGESKRLVLLASLHKIQIDLDIWDHLEWVFLIVFPQISQSRRRSKADKDVIFVMKINLTGGWYQTQAWQQRTWAMSRHGDLMEELLLKLVEGRVFSQSKLAAQRCLMWAIECDMVRLTEAFTANSGCELLITPYSLYHYECPLEFRHESPLELAERTRPHLAKVMAEKKEVTDYIRARRREVLDHLSPLIVVSALMAGFAFQTWLQGRVQMWNFQLCNGLGFLFAIAALLIGIVGSSPVRSQVKAKRLSFQATTRTIWLLGIAIAFEVAAFAIICMHESSPRVRSPLLSIGLFVAGYHLLFFYIICGLNIDWNRA